MTMTDENKPVDCFGSIRTFMEDHGIKMIKDYTVVGYVYIEMHDGRTGIGKEVTDALANLKSWDMVA